MKRPNYTNIIREYTLAFCTPIPLIAYYGEEGSDFARFVLLNDLFHIYGAPCFYDKEEE